MLLARLSDSAEGAEVGQAVDRLAVEPLGKLSYDVVLPLGQLAHEHDVMGRLASRTSRITGTARFARAPPVPIRPFPAGWQWRCLWPTPHTSTRPWKTCDQVVPEPSTSTPNSVPRSVTMAVGVRTAKRGEGRGASELVGSRLVWREG